MTTIDPLLKDREAAPLLGVSVPTFWRRVADGTVPKPIKLGALSRWPQSEILEVIERAKAARSEAA
ncbi:AlpA family transcriptional regulator [Paracoccus methylovorus]|uniref:AlpA family transcriptional regulator n=1 Tax=Paracoccus methylovorus TaxID=2812658 RepID=A0ABX7JLA6_9RHOB|nr:AlpA family transcriptional regulator [Paracoccus methylovorus]QRZ13734.1 AlpA family transcriptional regulator [Paracoccus methylovorus]